MELASFLHENLDRTSVVIDLPNISIVGEMKIPYPHSQELSDSIHEHFLKRHKIINL